MTSSNSIASLAILKVNYDEHGTDYVENFVPFVAEGLRRQPQDLISLKELQSIIESSFGIRIPQGALQAILNRAKKKGYVISSHGALLRNLAAIPDDFEKQSHQTLAIQRSIIARLIKYSKAYHDYELTEVEAEKSLLSYLHEKIVPILHTALDGKPLVIDTQDVPYREYILGNFLLHLEQEDPVGFSQIETITKGQMLASLLFLPDLNKVSQKFDDLTVFLDTKIILRALGLEGVGFQEPCLELIGVLQKMGVNVACFKQTFDELHGILDALENSLKTPSHVRTKAFSVMEFALSQSWRASDIHIFKGELELRLKKLRVYVREKPDHSIQFGVNETRFAETIAKHLVGQSQEAQHHDLDCCTSIHRLRRGQLKYGFETCGYIFVTTNSKLARAASEFFIDEYERFTIPVCITDHTLSTLAWVKNPAVSADLSRKIIIADSYAAIRPSRDLWKKYLGEINRQREIGTITDDQFQLLRFNLAARNALLETTHGMADAFTEGTVPEVLERVQKNITMDLEGKLLEQTEAGMKTSEEFAELKGRLRGRALGISVVIGKLTYGLFVSLVTIICGIGLFLTLPSSLTGIDINALSGDVGWMKFAIGFFSLMTMFGLLFGLTFFSVGRKFQNFVARHCERVLLAFFLAT